MATREADILAQTDPGDQDDRRARIAAARARREQVAGQITETGGRAGALVRGAGRGVTREFGDEIVAAIRTAGSLIPGGVTPQEAFTSESFNRTLEEIRERNRSAAEEFPITTGTGMVVGAALTERFVPGASITGAATLPQLARVGAVEGLITGAGVSRGGVAERARGAGTGAVVGAVAAPVVGGAARAAGAAGTRVLDITGLRPSREGGTAAGLAARFIDPIESRAERGLAMAPRRAESLTEAAERLRPARSSLATREVTGTTRPLTIMEADPSIARRARAAVTAGGAAGEEIPEFLAKRVAGQEERVIDDALRLTGSGNRASAFETQRQIVARRKEIASPLFEQAFTDPDTGALTTVPRELLGDVLDDPDYIKAYNRGRRTAAREGIELPELTDDLTEIPLQGVQFMKEGIDDIVGGLRRRGRANEARVLGNQLRNVMEDVKNEVPVYREALEVFAGEKKLEESLELGQRLFRMLPEEAEAVFAELSESEKEMFVRGGLSEAFNRIEGTKASFDITARRPLSTQTNDIRRMRLLFPSDEAFAEFQQGLQDEAQIAITNRLISGQSATADKLVEFAQFAGADMTALLSGNIVGIGARAVAAALGRRGLRAAPQLGEATIPLVTATGQEAVDIARRLENIRRGVGAELSIPELIAGGAIPQRVGGGVAVEEAGRRGRAR